PFDERACVQRARLARDLATALENDQCGDASNAVAAGDLLRAFGVELGESHAGFQRRGRAREVRRHGAARPAPRSPEVDDDGNLAPVDLSVETRGGELNRMAIEQAFLAAPANRAVDQAGLGHPVDGVAGRTGEVNGNIHGSGSSKDGAIHTLLLPERFASPAGRRTALRDANSRAAVGRPVLFQGRVTSFSGALARASRRLLQPLSLRGDLRGVRIT